jgi:hypothetical protein
MATPTFVTQRPTAGRRDAPHSRYEPSAPYAPSPPAADGWHVDDRVHARGLVVGCILSVPLWILAVLAVAALL